MSDDDCRQGGGGGEIRLPPPRGLADQLPVFPGTPGVQHEVHGYREQGEGDEVPDGGTAGRLRGVTRVRGEGVSHGGSLRDKHSFWRGATPARDSRQRQPPPLSIFTQGAGRTAGVRDEVGEQGDQPDRVARLLDGVGNWRAVMVDSVGHHEANVRLSP